MSMRFFRVTLEGADGQSRSVVVVPSKTEVQASDAAATIGKPGESVVSIEEVADDYQRADAMPAGTQTHPDRPA